MIRALARILRRQKGRIDRPKTEREKSHIVLLRPPAAVDGVGGRIIVAMRAYACEPSADDGEWVDVVPENIRCLKCREWWEKHGSSVNAANQAMEKQRQENLRSWHAGEVKVLK